MQYDPLLKSRRLELGLQVQQKPKRCHQQDAGKYASIWEKTGVAGASGIGPVSKQYSSVEASMVGCATCWHNCMSKAGKGQEHVLLTSTAYEDLPPVLGI